MEFKIFLHITFAAVCLMIFGWTISVLRKRAEIVDVFWALGTGAAGVWCAFILEGDFDRRLLLGIFCAFWGLRLGAHLFTDRVLAPKEDGRYADLRNEWGQHANKKFLLFFLLQAFLIPFLSTAAFAVAINPRSLEWYDFISVGIAFIAIVGEHLSDRQLAQCKKSESSRSKSFICRAGLWGWSRHPNYFFEWVYWLSFPILAWGSPYFAMVFVSPALMFYLIRYVTGVPPTEDRMLQSRGEAFKQYQKEVSAFFPWPPKL